MQSPSVHNNKPQVLMQQSMIPTDSWEFQQCKIHTHRETHTQEISQREQARYRCFEQISSTTMTSQM